jgi:hypothetical protein
VEKKRKEGRGSGCLGPEEGMRLCGVQTPKFLRQYPCLYEDNSSGWGRAPGSCTYHDSCAETHDLAPDGAWHHVPIADGQERNGDKPQRV